MSFCTAINCMDGRVQLPVIGFLKQRFAVEYVDSITEPGPILILSEQTDQHRIDSIIRRIDISVYKHRSVGMAVVAHHDCAGDPVGKDEQLRQLDVAVKFIAKKYPSLPVIGLWVDENWAVSEINSI